MTIGRALVVILIAAATVAAGCSSSNTSSTPSGPPNISGDYTGTVQDSVVGNLTATATFAQHGGSAGGTLTMTNGTTSQEGAVSLTVTASNAISGAIVEDLPGGTTCTFSTTGNYDTSSQQITGSYTAVTGCSGQNGTYTLDQQCYDTITSAVRRRMGVPKC